MHKILVVDDSREIRNLIRLSLPYSEFRIEEAENGTDAMRLIHAWRPDLVLLDVVMPGHVDGLQVCREVKQDALLRETIVVMLTVLGQQHDIEAGRAAGADAYIVKPFSPTVLVSQTRRILKDHPHAGHNFSPP
jgi:two-component system phosphate regulon response regulator PhoB